MCGRRVTQAERLNMRLPPDLKRRLDRLAFTPDFEMRPLSLVARKALECGLKVLEARHAKLDSGNLVVG
jgi:predicted transcriptional regulator